MNQTHAGTDETPSIETTTMKVVVTMKVAPKEGQSLEDAAAEMLVLFTQYLTERDGTFLTDYGANEKELAKYRASNDPFDQPTWGGYEGPFVLGSTVTKG